MDRGLNLYAARPQRLVGLIIILASLLLILAAKHWYETRIFVPLDQPISLAQGRINTPEFKINLSGGYWVYIDLNQNYDWDRSCDSGRIRARWKLSRRGQIVKTSVRPWTQDGIIVGPSLEYFDASPGNYRLQLELLSDASCLDRYGPQLRVASYESIGDNYLAVIWILTFTIIAGGLLVVRSYIPVKIAPEVNLSVTGSESFEAGTLVHLRKPRKAARRFSNIPSFGLVATWVLVSILIPAWIINPLLNLTRQSKGIWVHMPKIRPAIPIPTKDDFPVLRLGGRGGEIAFFVNSKPVTIHEVRDALNSALQARKARFVYLAVDPELNYSDAAQGIDIIHSVKAQVILYTPKMGGPDFKPPKPALPNL